jgi:predicted porin
MHTRNLRTALTTLALAAAAVTGAQAQSTSVYGLIDMSVGRTEAPGGAATDGVDSGKMTTSYIGFKGDEDLGGGLKAVFAIESFMRNDTGASGRFDADTFWARNSYVGLASNSMGTLTFGRNTTSLFVQTLVFNAFGDSFGFSPSIRHTFTSGTVTGDTGWSDSVKYASPKFGGLSFTLHGALGEANGGRNAGASASYFAGALGAGFAWQKVEKGATVDDTTSWQLAASYDLGMAKLFGQYAQVDNDTSGNGYDIIGLGATVPLGAGKLMAQWGQIDPDSGAERKTLSLGYGYNLSKRTDLYLAFMNDKISGTGSGNSYSLGVRHRF